MGVDTGAFRGRIAPMKFTKQELLQAAQIVMATQVKPLPYKRVVEMAQELLEEVQKEAKK